MSTEPKELRIQLQEKKDGRQHLFTPKMHQGLHQKLTSIFMYNYPSRWIVNTRKLNLKEGKHSS